jgi:hypothetical protein
MDTNHVSDEEFVRNRGQHQRQRRLAPRFVIIRVGRLSEHTKAHCRQDANYNHHVENEICAGHVPVPQCEPFIQVMQLTHTAHCTPTQTTTEPQLFYGTYT